jgi:predicted ATPase
MLRRIKVSGFKSLDDFHLEFNRGLNVIIGPNGSGKTNIINFIEFLSFLSRDSLLEAVGRSGGAGRIFRRSSYGSLTNRISFEIHGEGEYSGHRKESTHWAVYEFSADIDLTENNTAIYFSRQRFKIKPGDRKKRIDEESGIDIETKVSSQDKIDTTFHHLDRKFVEVAFAHGREEPPIDQIKKQIEGFCAEFVRNRAVYQILDRFLEGVSYNLA